MSTKAKLITLITLCSVITLVRLYMDSKVMLLWLKKIHILASKRKRHVIKWYQYFCQNTKELLSYSEAT